MIRRLLSAVSKYNVEVSKDNIFPLMLDGQSTKFYTFRPKTCVVNDKTVQCQLKVHRMIPKTERFNTLDGGETRWVTCGSPELTGIDLQIQKERLLNTIEKQ